ncbi:3-oxoacyl-(ACP) synthase III [Novosphingobium nitrogenifigens DSM 19370]|uniref:3-oxoacyl-(ACP) synthase III n=1 Tax=Novosphingobium nitrogenifigens DSM 19370 TaxID=983920 RepID=F1ZD28_9SPHN|nr:3-oxoacyl-[acyl-carrier-protein] synthase III C-terminal domain-containing protein [Novosphingobium nitrogenifigens]EGD57485.1 3-oxoacyl-(ACP) synthase III [Novosphingobium nitrogenifigens DSM 19370]
MAPPWRSRGSLAVLGMGVALPGEPLGTQDLIERIAPHAPGLRAGQVQAAARRLAIRTRHVARDFTRRVEPARAGARNPELAAQALRRALAEAGLAVGDLGYLIGHTATPARPIPGNVVEVADLVGYAGPHVELRQACTGFANALMIAFGLLASDDARPVAIVGSETGSCFFDPADAIADPVQRLNLVQMGDGAGAIVLGPAKAVGQRLHSAWFGAIGLGREPGLSMRQGGADDPAPDPGPLRFTQDYQAIAASGADLFEHGMAAAGPAAIAQADWVVPHQASGRIGGQVARHFGLSPDRIFVNADRVGNTGSAAIWIALATLRADLMAPGERTLVLGAEATKFMHGGFTYEHG